jgi:hypothetical protein
MTALRELWTNKPAYREYIAEQVANLKFGTATREQLAESINYLSA